MDQDKVTSPGSKPPTPSSEPQANLSGSEPFAPASPVTQPIQTDAGKSVESSGPINQGAPITSSTNSSLASSSGMLTSEPEAKTNPTNTWGSVSDPVTTPIGSNNDNVEPANVSDPQPNPKTTTPEAASVTAPIVPAFSTSTSSLVATDEPNGEVTYEKAWYTVAVARLLIGCIFLWSIFDKLFGLGFPTPAGRGMFDGSSATAGFLGHLVPGPFTSLFAPLAGQAWVDWIYMFALVGLAAALLLGIGLRIAAVGGSIFMLMLWAATAWPDYNPLIDEHIIYGVVLFIVALTPRRWSLVNWWLSIPFVKKNSWLW